MENSFSITRPLHGGNLVWFAELAGCSPEEILDFSASICPLGPPSSVLRSLAEHLPGICHYPTPGYGRLRQALASHHQCAPSAILPGNGAAELLTWAGRELASLEATYLFTPAFRDYSRSLQAFDGAVVNCPLPMTAALAGELDWDAALAGACGPAPSRSGLLVNTPHNPTGLLIPPAVIQDWLQRFALVVVDEAFMDFLPPAAQTSVVDWLQQFPNLVVLRSLTKFYSLPGLRLGYAIAHPDRLQRWQQWRDPWPVNSLAEVAALAALQDTAYQQRVWQWLPPCRRAMHQALQTIPGCAPLPGEANYLLVRLAGSGPALQSALLKKHQILVRDCLSFPELGAGYIRVAVRQQCENQRLTDAISGLDVASVSGEASG